jgi:hypothetical protein
MDDFEDKVKELFDKAMEDIGLVVAEEGKQFMFALYMSGFTSGAIRGVLSANVEDVKDLAKKLDIIEDLDKEIIH